MEGLIVGLVVMGVALVAAVGATIFLLVKWRGRVRTTAKLSDELNEVRRQQTVLKAKLESDLGYKALEAQVADLRALRDNLNGQVELAKVELGAAEAQITSAKTQFTDWTEAARHVKEDMERQENKLAELRAVGEETVKAEVEAKRVEATKLVETEAAQKRAEAETELVKAVAALKEELEVGRRTQAETEAAQAAALQRLREIAAERDALAASHAEALRRAALVEGEGGAIRFGGVDKEDADTLRRLCRGMRCENAVLKATYDVYVKPEIERLVREQGVSGVSGIYRIWRKDGDRELSYIGQAVDVGERWKTHAKRAWGVDNTGRIKLYQAMMESGIEEWHWELVEAVPVTVSGSGAIGAFLSEREKYWGGYYAVKEIGLNSKLG